MADSAGQHERFDVGSVDGTSIAVWAHGQGPPLVLVHGSLRDHTIFEPFVEELGRHVTTFAMDRRGFGASGDGREYSIENEFRDVAAVVDAVAHRTAQRVSLWGHSYGAGCALGAALVTTNLHRLILYEPGLGLAYPPGWLDAQEAALAAGRTDEVVHAVLADILEMTQEEIASRRSTPSWDTYRSAASTVLREARVEDGWVYEMGAFDRLAVPALVLVGTETAPALMKTTLQAMAAIPGARAHVLGGHGHLACLTHPALVAGIVTRFISERPPS
jgi:pimeloyl-ACP methyl ester carboxylesterase